MTSATHDHSHDHSPDRLHSHAHDQHAGHAHGERVHAPAGRAKPGLSLLRMSSRQRLAIALVFVAAIWLGVFWAWS